MSNLIKGFNGLSLSRDFIWIILYDAGYAIKNNIYPENWESESYAPLIREFVEKGGWKNDFYVKMAESFCGDDWYELYGLDCSGFEQWVYKSVLGVKLPGSTAGYSGYENVSYAELKVGDLGFYSLPGAESNHMGIYAGKNGKGQDVWIHSFKATSIKMECGQK